MEKLKNCSIVIEIKDIETMSGTGQLFEVIFIANDGAKCKLSFDSVWDFRCATENAYIDRGSKFSHEEEEKSSILLIENSDYIKYFEEQSSGTRPMNNLKDYIIFDAIDTVVEVLTLKEPTLTRL